MTRSAAAYARELARDEVARSQNRARAPRAHAALELVDQALAAGSMRPASIPVLEHLLVGLAAACDAGHELSVEAASEIAVMLRTATEPQRLHTVCCWCGIVIHQADPSRGVSHGLCSSDACYERQAGHPRRPDVKKGGAK